MILVTGANGFIGKALCKELGARGQKLKAVIRKSNSDNKLNLANNIFSLGDISGSTDWTSVLADVDCIVHCASPSQILNDENIKHNYSKVNIDGVRQLMKQAAASGVKRLVYISSIKVNGQNTNGLAKGHSSDKRVKLAFTNIDKPAPMDPYGTYKWKVEQLLWDMSAELGLEVVVVRPPLVYGPAVKGNLASLLKLVKTGVPLPLASIRNERSLIGLDNLVDMLIRCVDFQPAAGQTLLVSDGEDLSTPDLLHYIAAALGQKARLFPVPTYFLRLAGSSIGKRPEVDRLLDSLKIDSQHTYKLLDWEPKISVFEGIRRMIQS